MTPHDRLALFLEEANELLINVDRILFAAETSLDSMTINELFRAIHTLKGGAGLSQLDDIEQLAHELENWLQSLRTNEIDWSEPLRIQLIQGVGKIKSELQSAANHATSASGRRFALHLSIRFPTDFFKEGGDAPALLEYFQSQFEVCFARWVLQDFPLENTWDPRQCYLGLEITFTEEPDKAALMQALDFVYPSPEVAVFSATELASHSDAFRMGLGPHYEEWLRSADALAAEASSSHHEMVENWVKVSRVGLDGLIDWLERQLPRLSQQSADETRAAYDLLRSLRLAPLEQTYTGLERDVFEIATQLGKTVRFKLDVAAGLKADRTIVDMLPGMLRHLVRNAIDHGIEHGHVRLAVGKSEAGQLSLSIRQERGMLTIVMEDDGAGLCREKILERANMQGHRFKENPEDADVWQLLFLPGFSTAQQTSLLSGRGVGLDQVCQQIYALGGEINVESVSGQFTRFSLSLPDKQGLSSGLLVESGGFVFYVPEEDVISIFAGAAVEQPKSLASILRATTDTAAPSQYGLRLQSANETCEVGVDRVIGSEFAQIKPLGALLRPWQVYKGIAICHARQAVPVIDAQEITRLMTHYCSENPSC